MENIFLGHVVLNYFVLPPLDSVKAIEIKKNYYGFHEKCNENIEDSYIWPGAPEPASKCPNTEGEAIINLENVLKIAQTNYTIIIKYKYNENKYDFI